MKEKKTKEVKKEVKATFTPPPLPSENAEIERLRGVIIGLEESLNARGSEVIALRVALEERDKIIATLQSRA